MRCALFLVALVSACGGQIIVPTDGGMATCDAGSASAVGSSAGNPCDPVLQRVPTGDPDLDRERMWSGEYNVARRCTGGRLYRVLGINQTYQIATWHGPNDGQPYFFRGTIKGPDGVNRRGIYGGPIAGQCDMVYLADNDAQWEYTYEWNPAPDPNKGSVDAFYTIQEVFPAGTTAVTFRFVPVKQ